MVHAVAQNGVFSAKAEAKGAKGAVMPLSMARPGEQVEVVKLRDKSEDHQRHMCELGFVPGAQLTVVSAMGSNLIVEVKGTRLGLDGQMARLVMVQPV